jgi:hypothetical protein
VTTNIWIKIASKSFFEPERLDTYDARDKKYTIPAVTTTIRRFGPSGSLKKKNIAPEDMRAVIPKINSAVFFDLKFIFL